MKKKHYILQHFNYIIFFSHMCYNLQQKSQKSCTKLQSCSCTLAINTTCSSFDRTPNTKCSFLLVEITFSVLANSFTQALASIVCPVPCKAVFFWFKFYFHFLLFPFRPIFSARSSMPFHE